MPTSKQAAAGTRWISLAFPLGIDAGQRVRRTIDAFTALVADKAAIVPLKQVATGIPGKLADLACPYEPL
jgi:hypothetical protein